jgi:hypothetical protein
VKGVLYLCEKTGARILAAGVGITQLGDDYQVALETWDEIPAGEAGDCFVRGIDVTVVHDNGFHIGVTPVVDGVDETEQIFVGLGQGTSVLQAPIAKRGARIAARVRTVTRTGGLDIANIQAQVVPLREVP